MNELEKIKILATANMKIAGVPALHTTLEQLLIDEKYEELNVMNQVYENEKGGRVEAEVKPAKNVKDFDWLDNKLNDILAQFEHKHITKEGAKDLLYEFIFEELVNEIQKLKDSSLSV